MVGCHSALFGLAEHPSSTLHPANEWTQDFRVQGCNCVKLAGTTLVADLA